MIVKVLLALASTLVTAGALALGVARCTGVPVSTLLDAALGCESTSWGFELSFEVHPDDVGQRCGTCRKHATGAVWRDGPRDAFERHEPRELARSSLAWLQQTLARPEWRDRAWRWLELEYPSGTRVVRARHPAGSELAWDEQLEAWFERFPPTAEGGYPRGDDPSRFTWTLTFGDLGSVRGWAENDPEALAILRSAADVVAGSRCFGPIAYDLGTSERVEDPDRPGAVVMNCYRVETDDATEIGALPTRLAEQRAAFGSQIDAVR